MTSRALQTAGCVVTHFEGMEELKDEWQEMYRDNPAQSLFVSYDYVDAWYRHFAHPEEVRIFRVASGDRTVGFLPLVLRRAFGCRILESLTNSHCFHSGPLVAAGGEETFAARFAADLQATAGSWDALRLSFAYAFGTDPHPALLSEEHLRRHRISADRRIDRTFTIFLGKTYDEYFSRDLPSKTRKNMKMYGNRIRREGSVRYLHYAGLQAVERFPRFLDLEDSGWKGLSGSSIKRCSPNHESYYRRLLHLLAEKNALHLHFLEFEGKYIAGIFGYTDLDVFHCFKIAYDESFKVLSPSNLLLMHTVKHLMTTLPHIKRLHLFPWDGGYKHRFTNEEASCIETTLFSPTARGRGVELAYRLARRMKKVPGVAAALAACRDKWNGEG